jgi:hypothetical protein
VIYVEDQYLWSARVLRSLADALAASPQLRVIAVVPLHPDQGGLGGAVQIVGRTLALTVLREAGGDRFDCLDWRTATARRSMRTRRQARPGVPRRWVSGRHR